MMTNNNTNYDEDKTTTTTMTVDEALDAIGTGKFQKRILFSTGLCFAADSMEIMVLAFLSPILKDEWDLSFSQSAGIASVVFAGSLCGALILGPMGDLYGRRPVYLVAATIVTIFGFGTAFVNSYGLLLFMRFCVGFGVGGLSVAFDILAEFLPMSIRGKYLLVIEYFWTLGSMAVPALAYLTIGMGTSWNVFVFICAIPCFIGSLGGAIYVPESPHWLASQGRTDEAMDILKQVAITNGKDPKDIFSIDGSSTSSIVLKSEESENTGYAELLKPKWRRITFLLWGLWFGLAFSYYGTLLVVTRVFEKDGDSNNDDNNEDDTNDNGSVTFDYLSIFISSTAEIVGTTLVILTVDRWGRVGSQVAFYCLGGLFLYLLCIFANIASNEVLTVFAFTARIFTMSSTCCTWVAVAELFGTEVRTSGHSSAGAVSRLGGIIIPFIVYSDIAFPYIGVIFLVIHYFIIVLVMQTPETKGKEMGKAHEETSSLLTDSLLQK